MFVPWTGTTVGLGWLEVCIEKAWGVFRIRLVTSDGLAWIWGGCRVFSSKAVLGQRASPLSNLKRGAN